jgi:hypothetical protein
MAKLAFDECTNLDEWDDFVKQSPQGTIFSNSKLIRAVSEYCNYYFVKKGGEIIGAVNIILGEDERPLIEHPFMQYVNSIMFKKYDGLSIHKVITEKFNTVNIMLNELNNLYRNIHHINTPLFNDIRPFLWYNYHEIKKNKYINEIRYTAIVNIDRIPREEYIRSIRYNRRRDFQKAGPYEIEEIEDISTLNQLHELTFARQGIERSSLEKNILMNITASALKYGYGRLSQCKVAEEPASACLFLYDDKRSYYLFGANDPSFRNYGTGTKLLIDNILRTSELNLSEVDLVGANSPNRSDHKISYNADLKVYYSSTISHE